MQIRKIIILIFFLFNVSLVSNAQIFYGLKGGINLPKWDASINGSNISSLRNNTFVFGGFINHRINDFLSVQTELLYQQKGVNLNKIIYNQDYLNIPVVLSFDISSVLFFETGAQYGYLLKAKNDFGDISNKFSKNDFQLLIGGGVVINKKIEIGIRYQNSLKNISTSNSFNFINNNMKTEIRNNELTLSCLYTL